MWIRVVCAFDSDQRVRQLSVVGRAMLQYLWRRLMERGENTLSRDFFEPGYLALAIGSPPADIHEVARQGNLILALGLFKDTKDGYEANNWEKYQWAYDEKASDALVTGEDEDPQDVTETPDQRSKRKTRERVRAYRQRKKQTVTAPRKTVTPMDGSVTCNAPVTLPSVTCNASVTPCNAPVTLPSVTCNARVTPCNAPVAPCVTQGEPVESTDIDVGSSCSNNNVLSEERQIRRSEERIGGGVGEGKRGTPTPGSVTCNAPRHAPTAQRFGMAGALVPTEVKGQLALVGDGMPEPDPTLVASASTMVVGLGDGETIADVDAGLDKLRRETEKYPDEIRRLVVFMLDHMEAEKPDFKRPTVAALAGWHRDMNLIVNRDGRTARDVARVIKWTTHDPFWSANVRSPSKLREQFDRLEMEMGRPLAGPTTNNRRPPEPVAPPVRDLEAHMRQLGIIGGPK